MDQRRGHIAQDVSDIVQTRTAISEKLDLLEQRVEETVRGAKLSVEELIDHARGTADDFLDKTKQTVDPSYQVQQHPWLMVGAAIATGYVLGLLEARAASQSRGTRGIHPYYPPGAESEGTRVASTPSQTNMWEGVTRELSVEIEHAKQACIEAGRAFIHEFFQQLVPAIGAAFGRTAQRSAPSSHARDPRSPRFDYGPTP